MKWFLWVAFFSIAYGFVKGWFGFETAPFLTGYILGGVAAWSYAIWVEELS